MEVMMMMMMMMCMFAFLSLSIESLHLSRPQHHFQKRNYRSSSSSMMTISSPSISILPVVTANVLDHHNNLLIASSTINNNLNNAFGLLPLCLTPTSKTTTINDPTAGMTPEQITDYMSNVGGGMCGYPEVIRTSIGLGLNITLIVFGVFVAAYVILGGLNFALEKNVEDLISGTTSDLDDADVEDIAVFAKNAGIELKRSRPITTIGGSSVKRNNIVGGDDDDKDNDDGNRGGGGGISKDGMSREERRRKSRINKM